MNRLIKNKVSIYWFSGSGNTLLIAKEMKKNLEEKGYNVTLFPLEKSDPENIDTKSTIGFVVPVAMQGTYPIVWEFIKKMPKACETECFLVDTLASFSGGILGPIKGLLRRKGYVPLAAKEIRMPNIYNRKDAEKSKDELAIQNGKEEVKKFCDDLIHGKGTWDDKLISSLLMSSMSRSKMFFKLYRKMIPIAIIEEKCIGCKTCVKICPVNNWEIKGESCIPKSKKTCIICHRCFEYCPSEAIAIGKEEKKKYQALNLEEFMNDLNIK